MQTNRWLDSSQRIYACLLYLYPPVHRAEYGDAMLQLFGDQCRAAFRLHGGFGVAALWFRTLFDLGLSALSEHLSAPGARLGLLEAMPNKPLPWKGVALVLVPGLVLFASQVAQMGGENWFFTALVWTPYLLMAVVLLVWLITRKYPVWGLMPLGLLGSNMVYYASRLVTSWQLSSYQDAPHVVWLFLAQASKAVNGLQSAYSWMMARYGVWAFILGAVFLIVPALLIAAGQRRKPLSRITWILLGAYLLLSFIQVVLKIQNYLDGLQIYASAPNILYSDTFVNRGLALAGTYVPVGKTVTGFWTLYGSSAFLLLICLGILLARRYGDLAVLFPLGYVLSGIVYGYYGLYDDTLLYFVIGVVILYRILIAVVAPLWISRSAGRRRDWALAISVGVAFGAQILLHQVVMNYYAIAYTDSTDLITAVMRLTTIVDPLLVAVGLALAITLYRQATNTATLEYSAVPAPPVTTVG